MRLATVLLAAAALSGCASDRVRSDSATPAGDYWFVDRAEEVGLHFVHFNGMSGEFYLPESIPPGVGLLDFDNDGDLDVYLVQGQMLGEGKTISQALFKPVEPLPLRGRLFRNDLQVRADGTRSLRFTDVTDQSGIDARGYGMGIAAGDINNDGCIDVYLTNLGRNQMFRNNCDGTFSDVSKESGADGAGWGVSAAFLDYDRDGWLDLYVGNYVRYDPKTEKKCPGLTGGFDYCNPSVYLRQPDRLYRNQGGGRFIDVTATALPGAQSGPALGVSTADFNNDGWIDIYVANDGRANALWINKRNGAFEDMGLSSGAALSEDGKPEASMGVDAGDFDNDGDEDLFMTHLPAEGNNLYVNDGSGAFDDLSATSGLGPASLGHSGFGTAWFDFDNDGLLDLLAVNGAIQAIKGRKNDPFPYAEAKLLFRNLGNGRFADVTSQAGPALSALEVSRGAAFGDIDNDGDVDVLVGNLNGPARLLINNIGNRNHSVCLRLVDAKAGRDMLGARVQIVRKGQPTLWRRARADGSYASANDPRVSVGLGPSIERPSIRVRWPDGRAEEWPDAPLDRCTTLEEGGARP